MAKNKWIWVGCGGCLSVAVLLLIVVIISGYFIKQYVDDVQNRLREANEKFDQLEQDFPYETPESIQPFEEERFNQFLNIRDQTIETAEEEFDWLLSMIQEEAQKEFSFIEFIRNVINVPNQIAEIGLNQSQQLRQMEMSPKECSYMTKVMAAEINSWRDMEEDSQQYKYAINYFDPLQQVKRGIEKQKEQNPNSNIDPGPFSYEEFLSRIEDFEDPEHLNRDLILTNMERINSSTAAIFVDAIMVQKEPF